MTEADTGDLSTRSRDLLQRLTDQVATEREEAVEMIEELRAAIASDSSRGRALGPLLAQITAEHKRQEDAEAATDRLNWLPIGAGRLAIGHRPSYRSLAGLRSNGVTAIVTILSEKEGAVDLGQAIRAEGLTWAWFPLATGKPPETTRDEPAREQMQILLAALKAGQSVFIHCSAGIHRTGMFTYALLRVAGWSSLEAREALRTLRDVTADGVGDQRLIWGDRLVGDI